MSPAIKFGTDKDPDHRLRQYFRNKACRKGNHIGIVVVPGQGCNFFRPANSAPDTLVFVCRHSHPIGTAADHDSKIGSAIFNRFGHRVRKIRIIHRVRRVRAKVLDHMPLALQHGYQTVFIRKACMVTTYS